MRYAVFIAALCLSLTQAKAYESSFSYEQGTFGKVTLPYRKAVIGSGTDKPALVVYLHGGTHRGNDNTSQLLEPAVDSIANYLEAHHIHAVFVVPQCPAGGGWLGQMQVALKGMIDLEVAQHDVNRDKLYLFGGSMGGTGTWSMLASYPGLFTAAMPVAGNPSGLSPAAVAQTAVYTVMGTDDRIMSLDNVQSFVDSLTAYGAEVKFDIESGWTHENTCIMSYTSARLSWVFGHQSKEPTAIRPVSAQSPDASIFYNLQGQPVSTQASQLPAGIYIRGGRKYIIR